MNAHTCPSCGAAFWAPAPIGEQLRLPKHHQRRARPRDPLPPPCAGIGRQAPVHRPPNPFAAAAGTIDTAAP